MTLTLTVDRLDESKYYSYSGSSKIRGLLCTTQETLGHDNRIAIILASEGDLRTTGTS